MTPTAHPTRVTRRALALLGLATLAMTAGCSAQATPDPLRISLEEGRQLFESKQVVMFDIREPDEHATGVAAGAQLLPMRQLAARLNEIPKDSSRPVLLICNTQNRSRAVQQALKDRGYHHVQYVNGGMSEWARRGWPMVKPGAAKGPLK